MNRAEKQVNKNKFLFNFIKNWFKSSVRIKLDGNWYGKYLVTKKQSI